MNKIEFSPWPYFAKDEVQAVNQVLLSGKVNYWTGNEIKEFEKEFAALCNCNYAIALANGTVALELALYSLGIGEGDDVIVPCKTFIASASCAVMRGARPIIADVDLISQNITVETIKEVITPTTKAIIVVHLAGWPADMKSIMQFARENNLQVIEDCAQAHGAAINGQPVGSFGHAAAFSFCQDKIMTTGGEGGMLVTNSQLVWEKGWAFKEHGKSYNAVFNCEHPPGFRWLHESFGTNWRMTELQAAIGRVQLKKLDKWVKKRQEFAAKLTSVFSTLHPLNVATPQSNITHAYYRYTVFIDPEKLKKEWSRDKVINTIKDYGVPCFQGICSEIYLEKAFAITGVVPDQPFKNAKQLTKTSIMFLVHPTLTDLHIEKTCEVVTKVLKIASTC